jgi:L-alanine-DL-glutamate epimerase-like enolase superfamily enzyme
MADDPLISKVDVGAYRIPTDMPEADGTLSWDVTELLVVKLAAGGHTGLGYSYTAALPAASLVRDKLAPLLQDQCAWDLPRHWQSLNRALRNVGRPGLGLMAIAAVDQALWDLKAKLLNVPLSRLWGTARDAVEAYGSGGFTTYDHAQLQAQLKDWVGLGLRSMKIKLGCGIREDLRRVAAARATLGHEYALMVDANGAYTPREALALAEGLQEHDVVWLEEPVSSDDLPGMRWLRDRVSSGLAIAAGEYGWDGLYFKQMLASGAVDVLQADATRCGYTGFLQAAQLCEAFQIPLSAHCAPAVHVPLCAAVPRFEHIEYFHDHQRIEGLLFDGVPAVHEGKLRPNHQAAGHGLAFRQELAEQYRI